MRAIVDRPADAPLAGFVASIWCFDGADIAHAAEKILPDASMQLLVNLAEDELRWRDDDVRARARRVRGAALAGAYSRPFVIDTAQQRAITGVTFAPGGAAAFFTGSMRDVSHDHIALADLDGAAFLRDRLLEAHAESPEAVIATWKSFLRDRFSGPGRFVHRARAALERGGAVSAAADELSMSVRRFRREFGERVGLSPKAYARIVRFRRVAMSVAAATEPPRWAALAAEHGYFDQSHLIHEFRKLTGSTPEQYVPRSDAEWNHAPVEVDDVFGARAEISNTRRDGRATTDS